MLFLLPLFLSVACAQTSTAPQGSTPATAKAPFPYVWGTAYHILPETHTDESGYFSIVEGKDGKIYIGTAKYDYNAFLVEFDPKTETQKIVIDTNKVNGLTATGYASQSKLHTRNFVGPSGTVYVGSQEGYRRIKGDESVYPGGYVMAYDPRTRTARSLGMPMKGEGIIDVVADEARGLVYVVTTWGDDQKAHWLVGDLAGKAWRDLGALPVGYGSTLVDRDGKAHILTTDSRLATYDPQMRTVTLRNFAFNEKTAAPVPQRIRAGDIPTWQLTPDRKGAYVIYMTDPTLLHLDFGNKRVVNGKVLGKMLRGSGPDSRSSLSVAPDGRVYAIVKVNNETKFGGGYLHHLTRYDPRKKKTEDLGVLAVKNPKFFDFGPRADGTNPPWSHGYHTLPDGTMTPLHGHQGLIASRDGGFYALILYPYTLLHIPAESIGGKTVAARPVQPVISSALRAATAPVRPAEIVAPTTPRTGGFKPMKGVAPFAQQFTNFTIEAANAVEKNLPEITRVAEVVAERHLKGGSIGFPWNGQGLQQELAGRSGGLMNIAFSRVWKDRAPEGDKHNVAIIGWDRAPGGGDLAQLKTLREAGTYIIGFGSRKMPELAEHIKLSDAWFDTNLGADDRVVTLLDLNRGGRANLLVNMLNGWAFTGELVSALTRKGKMPLMWKAWMTVDGREWSDKYFGKTQFHDDFTIAPIAAGTLGKAFLTEMRANVRRFETELPKVVQAAELVVAELAAGRKTIVATQGHAPWTYVGRSEDARWGTLFDIEGSVPAQVEGYAKSPEGALVLRLGYSGLGAETAKLFSDKKQRVILISTPSPRPEMQPPADLVSFIDMGYAYGDAVVPIENYPIKILPPSGIMQIVAFEAVNVEVLNRLPRAVTK